MIGGNTGSVMSGMTTPIVCERLVRSNTAAALRRYPRRWLTRRILSARSGDTAWRERGLSAREMVDTCTPTSRAMSCKVRRERLAFFNHALVQLHSLRGFLERVDQF